MSRIQTHRGFTVEHSDISAAGYLDFPLVDTLYHRMETTHDWVDSFEYLTDVAKAAKQVLFNNRGQFILAQQLKEPSSPWVLHFTLSTLRFLAGEARAISLENYRDLMLYHPREAVVVDHSALIRELKLQWVFSTHPGQLISRWLCQEDGLTDLVMSLQLIGGGLPEGWHDRSQAA